MQVFPTTDPQAEATADLVTAPARRRHPAVAVRQRVDVKVGGLTAAADDFAAYTAERLPIFVGAVLLLSFLLLMVVFRSLLVPLKAVIMNLLSIGAAYGVVVAVFQWGWGASLIGVGREAPVEAWAPMIIFAIVFGLSMDYEVFLLSRIREEYDRTGDNATAVADGLALTARVITAAAVIMFFVFGSFVLGPEVALKLMGLGLAVAVLIDATIVRMVLVPATMELLGDWNWWLPKWLDRILPRVHVEGGSLEEELAELEEPEPTPSAELRRDVSECSRTRSVARAELRHRRTRFGVVGPIEPGRDRLVAGRLLGQDRAPHAHVLPDGPLRVREQLPGELLRGVQVRALVDQAGDDPGVPGLHGGEPTPGHRHLRRERRTSEPGDEVGGRADRA